MVDEDSGSPHERPLGRPLPSAFHRVEDERQARLLLDAKSQTFFRPFLARDRTVGEAAVEVGCEPSVMLYRVGTFLRAGLLRVVREEPRAGRALKVYRSSHDAYLVPYERTPFATLEEAFYATYEGSARRLATAMATRFRARGWHGYRLYRNAFDQAWLEGAPDAARSTDLGDLDDRDSRDGMDFALDLHLTPAQAEALRQEVASMLRRYRELEPERGEPEERPYLLSVAYVVLPP